MSLFDQFSEFLQKEYDVQLEKLERGAMRTKRKWERRFPKHSLHNTDYPDVGTATRALEQAGFRGRLVTGRNMPHLAEYSSKSPEPGTFWVTDNPKGGVTIKHVYHPLVEWWNREKQNLWPPSFKPGSHPPRPRRESE